MSDGSLFQTLAPKTGNACLPTFARQNTMLERETFVSDDEYVIDVSAPFAAVFRSRLKTHLFCNSYYAL